MQAVTLNLTNFRDVLILRCAGYQFFRSRPSMEADPIVMSGSPVVIFYCKEFSTKLLNENIYQ